MPGRGSSTGCLLMLGGLLTSLGASCHAPTRLETAPDVRNKLSAAEERDDIYSLLAYAVVLEDWQTGGNGQRGHNIGCVIVDDATGRILYWARNCNHITQNGTQHAEARAILGLLGQLSREGRSRFYYLDGTTLYTTLEPCAQCVGMMILNKVSRFVYGQSDPYYGAALERLALDTRELPFLFPDRFAKGYGPYPRLPRGEASPAVEKRLADNAFRHAQSLTAWLLSEEARQIFQGARERLECYEVRYPKNQVVLDRVRAYLEHQVTDSFHAIKDDLPEKF